MNQQPQHGDGWTSVVVLDTIGPELWTDPEEPPRGARARHHGSDRDPRPRTSPRSTLLQEAVFNSPPPSTPPSRCPRSIGCASTSRPGSAARPWSGATPTPSGLWDVGYRAPVREVLTDSADDRPARREVSVPQHPARGIAHRRLPRLFGDRAQQSAREQGPAAARKRRQAAVHDRAVRCASTSGASSRLPAHPARSLRVAPGDERLGRGKAQHHAQDLHGVGARAPAGPALARHRRSSSAQKD